MDRFIGFQSFVKEYQIIHLKSNMDRFIDSVKDVSLALGLNLKSNMDRFIGYPQTQP